VGFEAEPFDVLPGGRIDGVQFLLDRPGQQQLTADVEQCPIQLPFAVDRDAQVAVQFQAGLAAPAAQRDLDDDALLQQFHPFGVVGADGGRVFPQRLGDLSDLVGNGLLLHHRLLVGRCWSLSEAVCFIVYIVIVSLHIVKFAM
jgi:hypothetical protein